MVPGDASEPPWASSTYSCERYSHGWGVQLSVVGVHMCYLGALIAAEPAPVSLRNSFFDQSSSLEPTHPEDELPLMHSKP